MAAFQVITEEIAANSLLILTGLDAEGHPTAVAGHFTSMNVIYRKIKLVADEQKKKRTSIGFKGVEFPDLEKT